MAVITGDATDNTLNGTVDADQISGLGGNDALWGDAGNDSLDGGEGDDILIGGAGEDALYGGDGIDTASYSNSAAGVNVNMELGFSFFGDAEGDTLTEIENLTGSNFNDTLTGDSSSNRLEGGSGDDTLIGGGGADTIIGGAGTRDTASYGQSAAGVTVSLVTGVGSGGDAQGDTLTEVENLFGSAYADTLTGDGNVNAFMGGAGADTIDGGANNDTAQYVLSASAVTVNLTTGVNTGGDAQGDTLISIENLVGSNYDDTLTGNTAANTLSGGDGNDTLTGGNGNDTLNGGNGTDTAIYSLAGSSYALSYNSGVLTVTANAGSNGTDTLTNVEKLKFSDGTLTVAGNGNGLNITGDTGNNTINGTANNDILSGGNGNDTINGLGGNDVIDGGDGNDTINGGAGADIIIGSAGSDIVTGGSEIDVLDYSALPINSPWSGLFIAMHVSDVRYYAAGQMQIKDTISGVEHFIATAGADWMYGSGGDEIFEGGAGADIFDGAGGNDTLSYVHSSAGVTVNLATGAASGGDAQGDKFLGGYANPVDGSGQGAAGATNLWGSAHADTLIGNAGANLLRGNDGDDILEGGADNDLLEGGAGTDSARFSTFIDSYTITYNNGVITVSANSGTDGIDTLTGIEKLVFGGVTYDFTGWTGGALPSPIGNIIGTEGDDNLFDGSGNDVILAYGGNDVIHISSGNDAILGGGGTDRLDYTGYTVGSGWGGLQFNTQQNTVDAFQNGDWVVKDRFSDIEIITGTSQDDWFAGSGSKSEIWEGGAGADVFDGNGGEDTLSYAHSSAGVSVNLTTGATSGGDAQGDIITGSYTVPGAGGTQTIGAGITHLWGSTHADTLTGNSLSQSLRGNDGNDILTGGDGSDIFLFSRGDGIDSIVQAGIVDASSTTDIVRFDSGVSYDQLWFRQVGDDLRIDVIGETASSVLLEDWYSDATRRVDSIETVDGNHSLSAANVQTLVDAMAGYTPPAPGEYTLDMPDAYDLVAIFATTWA